MAAARKPLRAVAPGETARKKRLTITEAADAGDQRGLLVATRTRIARTVDDPNCPPRDLAALTRRLTEINREIEAIDARVEQEAAENVVANDETFDASAV